MGTFENIFWKLASICQYSEIFEIILKMFPKLFFDFFLHFWTRTAILYKWWIFHSLAAFSVHLYIKIGRFSIIILKMFPKLFFNFFLHFWTRTAILYKWWIFHNYKFFPHIFYPFENISLAAFDMLRNIQTFLKRTGRSCQYIDRLTLLTWTIKTFI